MFYHKSTDGIGKVNLVFLRFSVPEFRSESITSCRRDWEGTEIQKAGSDGESNQLYNIGWS